MDERNFLGVSQLINTKKVKRFCLAPFLKSVLGVGIVLISTTHIFSDVSLDGFDTKSRVSGYEIEGKVVIEGTPVPIRGVSVVIGSFKERSDKKGNFSFKLGEGLYKLDASANGYTSKQISFHVTSNTSLVISLPLSTVITAENQDVYANRDKERLSFYTLGGDAVKTASESFLFADTVTSLQMLPGVVSNGSFDASMYIRGGASYEVGGTLDGVPIYRPYFWQNRISIFNPKLVETVDFYPGGYGAKNGQSLSGIIDVKTKDGSFTDPYSEIEYSLTEVNSYFTQPIEVNKSTWMASYRRTYYDVFSPLFISSSSGPVSMPYLQAFQSKYTDKLDEFTTFRLGAYYFNEGLDLPMDTFGDVSYDGQMVMNNTRVMLVSELDSVIDESFHNNAVMSLYWLTGYYEQTGDDLPMRQEWSDPAFIIRDDVTWTGVKNHTLEFGGILHVTSVSESGTYTVPQNPYEPESVTTNGTFEMEFPSTILGVYIQDSWDISGEHQIQSGIRVDISKIDEFDLNIGFQPRLSWKWTLDPSLLLKTYVGKYQQQPYRSNRNILSATEVDTIIADLEMEESVHYGVGFEKYLNEQLLLKAEVFYKDYTGVGVNSVDNYPERLMLNDGYGRAKGFELMIQQLSGGPIEGWLTYTYSKSERHDLDGWYSPDYDVEHSVNLFGSYNLSKTSKITLATKWSTGRPYTPVLGQQVNESGDVEYSEGDRFSERFGDYFRLDIWFEKDGAEVMIPIPFLPSEHKFLGIFPVYTFKGSQRFGLYNALNSQSPTEYFWDEEDNSSGFEVDYPRMPVIGTTIYL